jgi:hypothetical protein
MLNLRAGWSSTHSRILVQVREEAVMPAANPRSHLVTHYLDSEVGSASFRSSRYGFR